MMHNMCVAERTNVMEGELEVEINIEMVVSGGAPPMWMGLV